MFLQSEKQFWLKLLKSIGQFQKVARSEIELLYFNDC